MRCDATASSGFAQEWSKSSSKSKEMGIERQAASAACAAPMSTVKDNHPKFNIMLATAMNIVADQLGKTGHGDPRSVVMAKTPNNVNRLMTPSNASSVVSGQSIRSSAVMIAQREY